MLYGHLPQGGCHEIRLARISGLPLIEIVVNDIHRLFRQLAWADWTSLERYSCFFRSSRYFDNKKFYPKFKNNLSSKILGIVILFFSIYSKGVGIAQILTRDYKPWSLWAKGLLFKTGELLLYGHLPQGGCHEIRLARISGLPLIEIVVNDIHRLFRQLAWADWTSLERYSCFFRSSRYFDNNALGKST